VSDVVESPGRGSAGHDLTLGLLDGWDDALQADREFAVVGRFLTCAVLLQRGEIGSIVEFRDGRVMSILHDADPTDSWQFALRAEPATWQRFLMITPPPGYHDIWAAVASGHMTLEGDLWQLLRNHYAFWRALAVLRACAQS
jgi:hypothetical protein